MIPLLVPVGLGLIGGYLTKESKHQVFSEGGRVYAEGGGINNLSNEMNLSIQNYILNEYYVYPREYDLYKNKKGVIEIIPVNLQQWESEYGKNFVDEIENDININFAKGGEITSENHKGIDEDSIVYSEENTDDDTGWQEYIYKKNGKRVPPNTPIGYEDNNGNLILFDDILYSDESDENYFAEGGGVDSEIRGGVRYVKGKDLEWYEIRSFDIADYGEAEAKKMAYKYVQEHIKYWNDELNENDFIVKKSRNGKDFKGSWVVMRQFPKYAEGGGVDDKKYEIRDYNDKYEGRYNEQGLIDWARKYAQYRNDDILINSIEDAKMYIESADKNGNQNFEIYTYAEGGGVDMGWNDLSNINPSKIEVVEINSFGYPDKLILKYEGKTIAKFYFNMKGYNPDFVLKNDEQVQYGFGGDRSKSNQISDFKKALKSGYTKIKMF